MSIRLTFCTLIYHEGYNCGREQQHSLENMLPEFNSIYIMIYAKSGGSADLIYSKLIHAYK